MFHYQMCVFRFSNIYEITAFLWWRIKITNYSLQIPCLSSTLWSNKDLGLYFSLSFHFHFLGSWLLKGWIAKLKSKQGKKIQLQFCTPHEWQNAWRKSQTTLCISGKRPAQPQPPSHISGTIMIKVTRTLSTQLAGMPRGIGTGCFSGCPNQKE